MQEKNMTGKENNKIFDEDAYLITESLFANAWGDAEPEYSLDDIKTKNMTAKEIKTLFYKNQDTILEELYEFYEGILPRDLVKKSHEYAIHKHFVMTLTPIIYDLKKENERGSTTEGRIVTPKNTSSVKATSKTGGRVQKKKQQGSIGKHERMEEKKRYPDY